MCVSSSFRIILQNFLIEHKVYDKDTYTFYLDTDHANNAEEIDDNAQAETSAVLSPNSQVFSNVFHVICFEY